MSAAELAELCKPYRGGTGGLGLALVVDDDLAKKLLATWTLLALPRWRKPRSVMPEDLRERWTWIWSGFAGGPDQPDFLEELARAAGVPEQSAFNRWPALCASRLVLPDGTISPDAESIVRAFVVSKIPKPPRQPAAPQPKQSKPDQEK